MASGNGERVTTRISEREIPRCKIDVSKHPQIAVLRWLEKNRQLGLPTIKEDRQPGKTFNLPR